MKVLYILNATTVYGGATKSFMPLLEGMKENGVEVCVVVPDSAGIYDVLNKKGIETYVVKMKHNVYIYILIMWAVAFLLRSLPLTLIRKEIKNKTIRSFLYYVPYVTLAVMTFPAIIEA